MSNAGPQESALTVPAKDGYPLAATLHLPRGAPAGLVLVSAATGAPARYYTAFAAALAGCGLAALTYDCRGIGASRPPELCGFGARMRDWIDLDAEGVISWARTTHPGLPLLAVGHSLGGHAIGLCHGSQHLAGGAMVSSAVAWIGYVQGAPERLRVRALRRVLGPALIRATGYAPKRWVGLGADVPGPAFLEWAHWIGLRRYFFDDASMDAVARFARVRAPLMLIGADDDPWTPAASIDLLATYFTGARCEHWQIDPADTATGRTGHAGFFRKEHRDTFWPGLTDWLLQRTVSTG
jgi:predicted alpha/beta hydrolase